ncbi:MAG: TolC family protein [Muribaculaceae bacterium]|nr:TolC family protein [Muribaculaceae bacterium]
MTTRLVRYIYIAVAAVGFIAATGSCSGVKNLKKPSLDLPAETVKGYTDSLSFSDLQWWEYYTDPTLKSLIGRALENNRDMLKAAARVEELRQLYGVEKLNYLPVVSGIVGATKETNDYYGEKYSNDPELSVKGTISWEADLWGALSYSKQNAGARFLATVENMRAMQMTIVAEVASAYFNLVALENELGIVKMTLATRREALAKAKLRFEGGLTSETVYQQAQVEYATTAAIVPNLEQRIEVAKNALSLLVGAFPGETFDLSNSTLSENLADRLPIGLPSTLLERRPDIRASEQQLKAALASCGVAYSNQFPRIRVAVTGGWENDEVANIFKSPFSYLLGNITGTIFDFGKNRRKYKASIAAYEQARLTYEQCVLNAFREVNDAVVTYRKLRETAALRSTLRDAALKYVELANIQYLAGTLNYIDVLDAQRRYFEARISLSNAVRDEYLALVNLYKVLGGGWTDESR